MNPADITNPGHPIYKTCTVEFVTDTASDAIKQKNKYHAALIEILAFAERRMTEGTREHADMQHIANIAKEAA